MADSSKPAQPLLPPPSAFLSTPAAITTDSACPVIVHLKRDHHVPTVVRETPAAGPAPVLQTRFGEFPHSTLVGLPYGSQVRASTRHNPNRKRKRNDSSTPTANGESSSEAAVEAASGFVHVLAPTAELWTASLPHRTQVVYTPDSSYILQKLGVKPGTRIIEAGAGSGSFTHAAVRNVYHGYPDGRDLPEEVRATVKERTDFGKVWSFEFHEERAEKLREEIEQHGLDTLVELTHKDVCKDGFLVPKVGEDGTAEMVSPLANAVFLDLPAPWLALPHLTRSGRPPPSDEVTTEAAAAALSSDPDATLTATIPIQSLLDPTSSEPAKLTIKSAYDSSTPIPSSNAPPGLSALDPNTSVRVCTFSPCIEQVTRTVAALRKLGWVDIEMEEVQYQRIEVRRQHQKGYDDGAGPRTLSEALARLKEVNQFRDIRREEQMAEAKGEVVKRRHLNHRGGHGPAQPKKIIRDPDEGRLITRCEPEIKTHTSYLTFATLPREWTEEMEEERRAYVESISSGKVHGVVGEKEKKWKGLQTETESKRAKKRREREERKKREGGESTPVADTPDRMDLDA